MKRPRSIAGRLTQIFLRDSAGNRPVLGGPGLIQSDPHWRDHIPFYEYFHGDNGAGLGASHQTGWTALVAELIEWKHRRSAAPASDDAMPPPVGPSATTSVKLGTSPGPS